MCLFVRNNNVSFDMHEDIPARPTTPRKPMMKICVINPAFLSVIEDNNIKVSTKRKAVAYPEKALKASPQNVLLGRGREGQGNKGVNTASWSKVDNSEDLLVEVFKQEPQQSGTVVGELDEKQQMRLLEDTSASEKLEHIKSNLDQAKRSVIQAKKNFLESSSLLKSLS